MPRFVRLARTPYSEQYAIVEDDRPVGRLDLHFTDAATHATLVLASPMDEDALDRLIQELDAELVMSADPEREDLVISVWFGAHHGTYAEDPEALGEDEVFAGGA